MEFVSLSWIADGQDLVVDDVSVVVGSSVSRSFHTSVTVSVVTWYSLFNNIGMITCITSFLDNTNNIACPYVVILLSSFCTKDAGAVNLLCPMIWDRIAVVSDGSLLQHMSCMHTVLLMATRHMNMEEPLACFTIIKCVLGIDVKLTILLVS